jgi:transcription elongation factor Elf1
MKTEKSYRNRFGNFKKGVCPYCGSRDAVLYPKARGSYVGHCQTCKASNNFTNPKCKDWYVEDL